MQVISDGVASESMKPKLRVNRFKTTVSGLYDTFYFHII